MADLSKLTPKQRELLMRRLEKETPGADAIPRRPRGEGENEFPLSFAQQRLWFLDRLEPGSPLYNLPAALEIEGRLDREALSASLREVIRRHEALRTTFKARPEGPVQVVHPEMEFDFPLEDLRGLPEAEREAAAWRRATAEARRPFDLTRGPLVRGLLLRLAEERHLAVLTLHHIVSDGWSMGVLVGEIAALYPHRSAVLPEPPVQYADFAVWQLGRLQGDFLEREVAFWWQHLEGAPRALDLPTDHPRPAVQTFPGAQAPFRLEPEALEALRAAGRGAGLTLFMQILAAWELLLHRWTGQDSLLVGSPIAGRQRAEVQGLIGLFVNTLVLRGDLTGEPTLGELLARVKETALGAFAHPEVPFGRLVEELHPERDLARSPLVQALFILQPAAAEALELPGLVLRSRDLDTGTAKLELTLQLAEGAGGVQGWIEYNTDLFDPATAERMAAGLGVILEAFPGGLVRLASELPVLAPMERRQILGDWNATGRAWPEPALLHELFERQAARTPGAPAVSQGGESLTYGELDESSNRLARALRAQGVGPEVRVGLCVERSMGMVVALLGILKAGGAYVPLDPGHPAERLATILEDSAVAVLVTETGRASLPFSGKTLLLEEIGGEDPRPLPSRATEENLAYVIYTSGSTGRPKGVQLPHRALVSFLRAMAERPGLGAGDVVPALTTLAFDIAGLEIYLPLSVGGRVEIVGREDAADGRRLAARLAASGATVVQATPATWRLLVTAGWRGRPGLKGLCGGEALPRDLAADLLSRGVELWNVYGPTETAIWSTAGRVTPGEGPVLLGSPIANTRLYVMDSRFRLAPVGAAGELLIGGAGLARGYLGRPELTAEKFVPDPFSEASGARLYRTGDLVRRRPSGELEFLGRIDHQVKVRGFRIELGEIEAALLRHPAVAQAVVVARPDSGLAAYVVTAGAEPSVPGLREHLRRSLPEYMVPSAFTILAALPLNSSGKVDRGALPAPGEAGARGEVAYADPRGGLELTLADLWREVLGIGRVGIHDNFFDLGGHSLLAAQVQMRLTEALGREVALLDLFRYPTVASLAAFLGGEAAPAVEVRARPSIEPNAPIAIIGLAGRFPGARSVEELWQNLVGGVESITFFSDEELRAAGVPEAALTDPRYVRARGIVAGAEDFDAPFFGYSPREAEVMDPQQRLFLECAWEAFEDAGHEPAGFPGRVGVFAGAGMNTYLLNFMSDPERLDSVGNFQLMIGNDKDYLAPRVSYKLGLTGPSVSVQSACSTSLVAVHLACQSLLAGQCDAALAGGVSLRLPQAMGYQHHEGAVFSPDGHCRAFDAAAGGFVGGNGAAVVLLRRLEDALRDGDAIRAVIRGSAVNNDGSLKAGFTAPSIDGQSQVIAEALAAAGVEPASIGYVEAHGTGTELGDPIEIAALSQAFGAQVPADTVRIGSLKTNIGHLDSAAGAAGLIKAALVVERGQIPPSLHFETPNPKLALETTPFRINDRLADWPAGDGPRRAGVSSLGIGGTNAHAVVEEPPAVAPGTPGGSWQLLPLSARGEEALERALSQLADHLKGHPDLPLADVAWTLQVGRRRFEHRAVALCRDGEDAVAVLEGGDKERLIFGDGEARTVAFLFSGQGSQHPGMATAVYRAEPVFRAELDRACDLLVPLLGRDLRDLLFGSAGEELERTELTQPALFAVEHALARQWMAWGIRPSALLGHSIGEYVAACLAGVFSLEDALALVVERGRRMGSMAPGSMLAVSLSETEILPFLGSELSLGAVNAPGRTVISGPSEAIDALIEALEARGIRHRRLHTSHAFHSAQMEPALAPFTEAVRRVRLSPPSIPFLSNVTGTWITAEQATDPRYWAAHLRGTVRFSEGITELTREPGRVLLEAGPGNALTTLAREAGATAFSSLPHPSDRRDGHAFLLTTLGRLWLAGIAVDWRALHEGELRLRVPLPTYPFQRRRYWVEGKTSTPRASSGPGLEKLADPADWLSVPSWKRAPLGPSREIAGPVEVRGGGPLGDRLRALLPALGDGPPRTILHVESLGAEGYEEAQERGFRSLLALARSWDGNQPLDLLVVTNGLFDVDGTEELRPERATLLGPARVIPWEMPGITCRVLDAGPSPDPQVLLNALASSEERVLALRGRHVWIPTWEPVRLDDPPAGPPRIRDDGVYLVTGGTGGLGLEMAAALAQGRRVRLVLLSRSAANEEKLAALWRLEELGAEVLPLAVDLTDRTAVARALEEARGRFGPFQGLVHAAGARGGGAVQLHTAGELEAQMAATVQGLLGLEELLADDPLDFVVLAAPAAAHSGEPGQTAQGAAGAFLDAWAQARTRHAEGPWTVAIDWDTWRDVGRAADLSGLTEEQRRARLQVLSTGITPAEGREVFLRVLERGAWPQVIVSTKDLAAVREHLTALARAGREPEPPGARAAYARPDLKSTYQAPRDDAERTVAGIWAGLLGLDRVGIDDNFFDLGGHSLLATQVMSRLRDAFGVALPLDALFAAPTVAGLAAAVSSAGLPEGDDPEDLDALLREIEEMSAAEAQSAYLEELTSREPS